MLKIELHAAAFSVVIIQDICVLALVKIFRSGQQSEEDKGRVDGSAADVCVVIKDAKLRQ